MAESLFAWHPYVLKVLTSKKGALEKTTSHAKRRYVRVLDGYEGGERPGMPGPRKATLLSAGHVTMTSLLPIFDSKQPHTQQLGRNTNSTTPKLAFHWLSALSLLN